MGDAHTEAKHQLHAPGQVGRAATRERRSAALRRLSVWLAVGDAASLVLVRDGAAGPEVLMGRRPRTARFMPGVYVFPGGAVDKTDFMLDSDRGFAGHVLERVGRKAAAPLAQALGWTAVRETWEETGLLFGAAGCLRGAADCPAVRAFAEAGLAPDLSALDYLMRAVTPPYIRIRFNTRFFIADGAAAQGTLQPCPELEEVGWHPIDAALGHRRGAAIE